LEVPVSVGYSRPGFRRAQRIRRFAERPALRRFHLVGALDRLNLVRRIKFSPEQADAARLRQLVDAYTVNRAPCVVMMLHSSSLVTGCSPYARDERKLEDLYHALTATFEYCVRRRGMGTATLTGFAQSFMGGPGCRE
jgi:hypothetical protein